MGIKNSIIRKNNFGNFTSSLASWTLVPGSEITIKKNSDSNILVFANFSYTRAIALDGLFSLNYEINGGLYCPCTYGFITISSNADIKSVEGMPILISKNQSTELTIKLMIYVFSSAVLIGASDPAQWITAVEL